MNKIISIPFTLMFLAASLYIIPSCSVTTANLSDVKICTSTESSGECTSDISSVSGSSPIIYCTAQLKNAPSGTKVIFEWKKGSESMGKADVESASGVVSSTFKPSGTLEPGKYSVTVRIDADNPKPVTKEFSIE